MHLTGFKLIISLQDMSNTITMQHSNVPDTHLSKYLSAPILDFESAFHEFIKDEVVKIIRTDGSWSVGSILKEDAVHVLIGNIFKYLLGEDIEESLLELEKLNDPPRVCGRVFKPGEPTYSCRDCAMDPTCVLCHKCFWHSEHAKHKYRMNASGGGGCCDCGDVEAWHNFPACRLHQFDGSSGDEKDEALNLPAAIQEKAPYFFEVLLKFFIEFLTVEKTSLDELPTGLRPSQDSMIFSTVLVNDESHTFDFVINVLKEALKCTEAMAADFATVVDREGRSIVYIGDKDKCEGVKRIVGVRPTASVFLFRNSEPLKTLVMHVNILALQELCLQILPVFSKIVMRSEGLRTIFCSVCMSRNIALLNVNEGEQERASPVEVLMRCDHILWKAPRNLYLQLIMNSVLLNVDAKKTFAILFTRLYDVIEDGFMEGDHEHMQSVASLSVQLYTVPSIARYLIEHENVIGVIINANTKKFYKEQLTLEGDEWCRVVKIERKKMRTLLRRSIYALHDLRYVLTVVPSDWTASLKTKFLDGLKQVLQFMMSVHGMDGVVRRVDIHIEHEPDWETGTTLMFRLYPIINSLLRWIASDTELLFKSLGLAIIGLKKLVEHRDVRIDTLMYHGKSYQLIDNDITLKEVSIHCPVTRFTAAILVELGKAGLSWQDIRENGLVSHLVNDNSIQLYLLEYSMCCLSLNGQVNSGMWRRNGQSLVSQLLLYRDHRCREEAFYRDIQMMQFCASVMDPDHFLVILQNKMKVLTGMQSSDYYLRLMGEVFTILIAVVGERYVTGLSDITVKDSIRRVIIHILAIEAKPRSKIVKLLPENISNKSGWEQILKEVADFAEPTSANAVGKYSLKSEVLDEFCPYSYQYSPSEETRAQQAMAKRKSGSVFLPPKSPRFSKLFSSVPYLLSSDTFVSIMSNFLQVAISSGPQTGSDRVLGRALYLLAMALGESKDHQEHDQSQKFHFLNKSVSGCENSILFLLNQLKVMEVYSSHRAYLTWLTSEIERRTNLKKDNDGSSVDLPVNPATQAKEENNGKTARKRKAQEMRTKLLSQMRAMQQNFLSSNPDFVGDDEAVMSTQAAPSQPSTKLNSPTCMDISSQLEAASSPENVYTCMLCQEDSTSSNKLMVMSALVQRSSVLCKGPRCELGIDDLVPQFVPISTPSGIHASTCSHTMHYECFKQFSKSSLGFNARRIRHRHRIVQDSPDHEFLCPLCSRLSNTVIPLISRKYIFQQRGLVCNNEDGRPDVEHLAEPSVSLKDWLESVRVTADVEVSGDSQPQDQGMDTSEGVFSQRSDILPMEEDNFQTLSASQTSDSMDLDTLEPVTAIALSEFLQSTIFTASAFGAMPTSVSLATWLMAATTVVCTEKLLSLDCTSVLSKIPVRLSAALEGIIRTAYAISSKPRQIRFGRIRDYAQHLISCASGEKTVPAILNCDIFSIFTYMWFSAMALPETAGSNVSFGTINSEKNILRLCTVAQLVQIFVRLNIEGIESAGDGDVNAIEATSLVTICNSVRSLAGLSPLPGELSSSDFYAFVKATMLSYLRCCVLLLSHVTGVFALDNVEVNAELTSVLKYLELPANLSELLRTDDELWTTVEGWVSHPQVLQSLSTDPSNLFYPKLEKLPDLVPLPSNYGQLVEEAAAFICPKFASDDSLHPTMCLVCGEMLCSQSYCCQRRIPEKDQLVGACTFHARTCGAGTGLFLRVRESTIVLLDNMQRGTFISAPYLDVHGETDKGMRRGDPLYLNMSRLMELRKMWLSHGIAEKISYDNESGSMRYIPDWAHL